MSNKNSNKKPTSKKMYSDLLRAEEAQIKRDLGLKKKNQKQGRKQTPMSNQRTDQVKISIGRSFRSGAPRIRPTANGGSIVEHIELVSNVQKPLTSNASGDPDALYQALRLRVNPGSEGTFKWLSKMALLYEFYRFRSLEFHYETRSPSTGEGSVVMSPDYDSADGNFAVTESMLFNNKGSVDTPVWVSKTCRLDPSSMNRLFKSHACMSDSRFASTTQDVKTIDVAQLFVMLDTTLLAAYKYGKLFTKYSIEFFNPQAPTELINLGGSSFFSTSASITANSVTPIAAASVWTSGLTSKVSDPNVLVFPNALPDLTYPSAVIGRFAKDYNGILNMRTDGSVITSGQQAYVGSNPNTAAGGVGDVLQVNTDMGGAIGIGSTAVMNAIKIAAKAGDYLKVQTPTSATLSKLAIELGGVTLSNLL
jgi:hypothetical protein